MGNEKKLSFIIVNYQSREYLKNCLLSIKDNLEGISFEVIVINEDGSELDEKELPKIEIKIININKNIGFGKSANIGAKKASGKYFCFLNPDTLIISKNIGDILDEFKKNNPVGIIGPKLISEKNEVQRWSAGKDVTLFDLIGNNIGIKRSKKIWESNKRVFCDWVSGAAMFIRRDLFFKVGGFDENFFMYYEDIDLCRSAKKMGFQVAYYPKVEIRHFGGKSFSPENNSFQKKCFYNSQDYYFKKHFGNITAAFVGFLRRIFA